MSTRQRIRAYLINKKLILCVDTTVKMHVFSRVEEREEDESRLESARKTNKPGLLYLISLMCSDHVRPRPWNMPIYVSICLSASSPRSCLLPGPQSDLRRLDNRGCIMHLIANQRSHAGATYVYACIYVHRHTHIPRSRRRVPQT